ncbi:MAG TPA: M13-type metalloendopeptidase [Vicinamibacterales bacterium]|nr:M13-type metalloendopeptidase [Vicinamibacterales bacterium]
MRSVPALLVAAVASSLVFGQPAAPKSGLDLSNFDTSVRPQDDLFTYANGGWAARASIPGDRVTRGAFTELADRAELDLRTLIEEVAGQPNRPFGSPAQQVGDLYASLMDEDRLEALGSKPIDAELARIDAIVSAADLGYRCGYLATIASGGPFAGSLTTDAANPARSIFVVSQGGTLLPERGYYLSDDAKYAAIREAYVRYLTRIFELTGRRSPARDARAVLALETQLALAQLPHDATPDENSTRFRLDALMQEMPGFDWIEWGRAQGVARTSDVIVAQPSFFRRLATLVQETPVSTWRAWLAARHITASAPFLSAPFADARFDFFGRTLSGQSDPIPQWKRAVSLVNGYLGDAVGKLYVERHFPPESKARVERLVANMLEATRQAIADAEWMTPRTRAAALEKLAGMVTKVGYPDRWRDYRGLVIRADDLVGNVERAQRFDTAYRLSRVRRPEGRGEWLLPPQTVNAYYSPRLNEIVVPAAMLQPPLFQMDADEAVNYGGIGAVVGHELGHGFDGRGRFFDAGGAPRDWWEERDAREFRARAERLVLQFNGYRPLDGMQVNGGLTLDENVGDLGGLALAYRAYRLSLGDRTPPVIDGFTGDQRFFLGWAQVWRSVMREEYLRQWLAWIPHAPPQYRANGPVGHLDGFHAAFNVQPGDRLYVAPEKRIRIW